MGNMTTAETIIALTKELSELTRRRKELASHLAIALSQCPPDELLAFAEATLGPLRSAQAAPEVDPNQTTWPPEDPAGAFLCARCASVRVREHGSLCRECAALDSAPNGKPHRSPTLQDHVSKLLNDNPSGASIQDLARWVGTKPTSVSSALNSLRKKGIARNISEGVWGPA